MRRNKPNLEVSKLVELFLIISFAIIGAIFGCLTGIIPGFHVNSLALLLLSFSAFFISSFQFLVNYGMSEDFILLLVATTIISTSIAHTFVNFIPSTFLGAPEGETALTVLPAHEMVLNGDGFKAVYFSAIASFFAIVFGFAFLIPYKFFLVDLEIYLFFKKYLVFIILGISLLLIFSENAEFPYKRAIVPISAKLNVIQECKEEKLKLGRKYFLCGKIVKIVSDEEYFIKIEKIKVRVFDKEKIIVPKLNSFVSLEGVYSLQKSAFSRTIGIGLALFVFLLSGIFGIIIFGLSSFSQFNPPFNFPSSHLFPTLTGLFGFSTLLVSLKDNAKIPKQKITFSKIDKKETTKSIFNGTIFGSFTALLPGITSSHATILSFLTRKTKDRGQFILTICAVNTAYAFFTLAVLFLILKERTGVTIVISNLISIRQWQNNFPLEFSYLLIAVIVSSLISLYMTIFIGKLISTNFDKIPYRKLIFGILIALIIIVFVFNGIIGLMILFTATSIGLIPIFVGVRRSHCMGVLLLPIILWLL